MDRTSEGRQFIDDNVNEKVAQEITKSHYKSMIKKKVRQKCLRTLRMSNNHTLMWKLLVMIHSKYKITWTVIC